MNLLGSILYDTVYYSTPIVLCTLGGLFSYNANVLNIGLEGMMLMGAFSGALFTLMTGSIVAGMAIGVVATCILGLIFSYLSVNLKSNFIITGFGINILVSALSAFVLQYMQEANLNLSAIVDVNRLKINIPLIKDIPIVSNILSGHPALTYIAVLLVIAVYVILYKTKLGLYIRVVGENEDSAKSVGIKVGAIKYAAIIIGAVLCALAGANLSVERMGLYTNNMTAGRGFIALAAFYCGKGKPVKSTLFAMIFGLAQALSTSLSIYAGGISGLLDAVPYLTMVIVLAVVSATEIKHKKTRSFNIG
ncbi:inner-membrane translocator [[Clostridium] cellulosi]|jgi:nucleoside ABC transporter membrane protein|uniref:Inner-membrane translocator n=1 Tax=[Clostridium] cellulosi TaxID=29343 RepID=A0A078KS03_9FIRM|nr:inner-membrane translocator [[Clostridium] cellulosi]